MIFKEKSKDMLQKEIITLKKQKLKLSASPLSVESDSLLFSDIYSLMINSRTYWFTGKFKNKNELKFISKHFDTVVSGETIDHSDHFKLIGALTYFLIDNFGSAKVMLNSIHASKLPSDILKIIYSILYYYLNGKKWEHGKKTYPSVINVYEDLYRYFESGFSKEPLHNSICALIDEVLSRDIEFDVVYVYSCAALIKHGLNYSAYLNLNSDQNNNWNSYLSLNTGVRLLWPAQLYMAQDGLFKGRDMVVPLPAGAGKTKSIDLIIRSKLYIASAPLTVMVIAPLRALCTEIKEELRRSISQEIPVNSISDVKQCDYILSAENSSVTVCTPEKLQFLIDHNSDLISKIDLFIFDEAHLISDANRGPAFELLLTEVKRSRKTNSQIVLFSAMISNPEEIAEWMFEDPAKSLAATVQSSDKDIGLLDSRGDIHFFTKGTLEENYSIDMGIQVKELPLCGRERNIRVFPDKKTFNKDMALYFALRLCSTETPVAVFVSQARTIRSFYKRLRELEYHQIDFSVIKNASNFSEMQKLAKMFARHYGQSDDYIWGINHGMLPHCGILPDGLKKAVEYNFNHKYSSFVVCTSTLAEGVNIPIKYLFITSFYFDNKNKVQTEKIHNLIGRVARPGMHSSGTVIVTDPSCYENLFARDSYYRNMTMFNTPAKCRSGIDCLIQPFGLYKGDIDILIEAVSDDDWFDEVFSFITEMNTIDHIKEIALEKLQRKAEIIAALEKYITYLSTQDSGDIPFSEYVTLCMKHTFAFQEYDDSSRTKFLKLIKGIVARLERNLSEREATFFAQSFYPFDISKKIYDWCLEHIIDFIDDNRDIIMAEMYALFLQYDQNGNNYTKYKLYLSSWLEGEAYCEMVNSTHDSIKTVEHFCKNTLSENYSSFIGTVLDACNNLGIKELSWLKQYQKEIKYGVNTMLQVEICENIVNDRLFACDLESLMKPYISSGQNLKEMIKSFLESNDEYPLTLPEYYKRELSFYGEKNC